MQTLVIQAAVAETARIQPVTAGLDYLAAGAHAAGHQQHVQRRMVGEGVVGQHAQPLGAADRVTAARR